MKNYLLIFLLSMQTTAFATPAVEKDLNSTIYRIRQIGDIGDEVSFGDLKNPSVEKTKVNIKRWNGEHTLSIIADSVIGTPSMSNGQVKVSNLRKDFYFNAFDDSNVKFGLIFKEKPSTNTFQFQLEGWEEFNFFYQPPLANSNPDGSTWEPNDPVAYAKDGSGGVMTRPVDVNGSYAVYHKWKRDGEIYKTGKFCHIYRPRFIDANGDFVWGDLDITDGVYTVTIPQDFLDHAVYPVKANDTLGDTSIGATDDSGNNGVFHAAKATMPANGGTCSNIKAAVWVVGNFKMAIFNDVAGTPSGGSLVTNSSSGAVAISQLTKPTIDSEWTGASITASLNASSVYWLAWTPDSDLVNFALDTGGTRASKTGQAYANFPVDPFPASAGITGNQQWSIYATYTKTNTKGNFFMVMD